MQFANLSFKEGKLKPRGRSTQPAHVPPALRNNPFHVAKVRQGTYVAICCRVPSLAATGATPTEACARLADKIVARIDALEADREYERRSWLARASAALADNCSFAG